MEGNPVDEDNLYSIKVMGETDETHLCTIKTENAIGIQCSDLVDIACRLTGLSPKRIGVCAYPIDNVADNIYYKPNNYIPVPGVVHFYSLKGTTTAVVTNAPENTVNPYIVQGTKIFFDINQYLVAPFMINDVTRIKDFIRRMLQLDETCYWLRLETFNFEQIYRIQYINKNV